MTTICIGRKGAGKTHLLSCLREQGSINETSHSVPSVGTNIFRIKNPKDSKNKKPFVEVREIGGTMAPIWNRYYENVNRVIFVIDTSNLCEISGAGEFRSTECHQHQINCSLSLSPRSPFLCRFGGRSPLEGGLSARPGQDGFGLPANEE